ncbi:hypothetical protein BOX15_Mlig028838g2 [Macrostomum lignano]|uniref:Uncharacterized protein n=1 Tax=Macrostomum lignano TaxID=282301 RepID=A0A267GAW2_9PLAT|nr:hypothetical protein BOX15_Mlig028838g2 [Macrostomum lignano]
MSDDFPERLDVLTDFINGLNSGRYRIGTGGHTSTFIMIDNFGKIINGKYYAEWVFRFDMPHKGCNYSHLNINSKIFGFPDPHTPIPDWMVNNGKMFGEGAKKAGKLFYVIGLVADAGNIGKNMVQDYRQNGFKSALATGMKTAIPIVTTRLTGVTGSSAGAAVGTFILPGVGTVVGSYAGTILTTLATDFGVHWLVGKL